MSNAFIAHWWEDDDDGDTEPPVNANAGNQQDLEDSGGAADEPEVESEAESEASDFGGFSDRPVVPSYPEGGYLQPDGTFKLAVSIDHLLQAITAHGLLNGYGVNKRNAGNKNKEGVYTCYRIECDRFGKARPSRATTRKTSTRKTGCQWKGRAVLDTATGGWKFRFDKDPAHHQHNHPPTSVPTAIPKNRKVSSPIKRAICTLSEHPGIRARDVTSIIAKQFPESNLTQKDVNNQRAKIRREAMGGLTPTGALIRLFDDKGINYVAKYHEDDPDRLHGLVWSSAEGEDLWKRFPEALGFDNTHKTNYLGYPLFVVIGSTNCNTTFNAAFGLIDTERKVGFDFLFQAVEALRTKINAQQPKVTITDRDDRMKAALTEVWPFVEQQLCIYHVIKNVKTNLYKKWKKTPAEEAASAAAANQDEADQEELDQLPRPPDLDSPIQHNKDGFLHMFQSMVYALTEDRFLEA